MKTSPIHSLSLVLLLLVLIPFSKTQAQDQTDEAEITTTLNAWHKAAAGADEARYFGFMATGAVFMGTDATERWSKEDFQIWAKPYFERGKAWNFTPKSRFIYFSADHNTAWFDETLETPNLGLARGSGVLTKSPDGRWLIGHYNLSIPIPNDLVAGFVEQIETYLRALNSED